MMISKDEVIKRFCILSKKVVVHCNHEYPGDCFCGEDMLDKNTEYQFDERIMAFIEYAVKEKMEG